MPDKIIDSDAAKNSVPIGRSISILSCKIRREIDHVFSDSELTGVQSKIMHYIYSAAEKGDIFQKDITEKFCLRRSTATEILNLIEKAGMISRESVDYDARLRKIVLTDKAKEFRQRLFDNINTTEQKLIEDIPRGELDVFMSVISKMSDNIDSISGETGGLSEKHLDFNDFRQKPISCKDKKEKA